MNKHALPGRSSGTTRTAARPFTHLLRMIGPVLALALALTMSAMPQAQAAPSGAVASSAAASTGQLSSAALLSTGKRHVRPIVRFRNRIIRIARRQAGTPYRYGATGPHAFDCSGYTSFVFRKAGRVIPRTSRTQAAASRRIRFSQRRRGDLVFFHSRGRVYHVGIYAGNGYIWHSPSTGKRVSRQKIWTSSHFYGRFHRRR